MTVFCKMQVVMQADSKLCKVDSVLKHLMKFKEYRCLFISKCKTIYLKFQRTPTT